MTVTWQMLLTVCPLVFLAGFVASAAGGGGLISLPAYYLAGLPPVLAAGTNKLSACLGTVASSARFLAGGKVRGMAALLAACGAFPGSWLGTLLLQHIPENTVRVMLLVVIPCGGGGGADAAGAAGRRAAGAGQGGEARELPHRPGGGLL